MVSRCCLALAILQCVACNLTKKTPRAGTLTSSAMPAVEPAAGGQPPAGPVASDPQTFHQAAWPIPEQQGAPYGNSQPPYQATAPWQSPARSQAGNPPPQQGWPSADVGVSAGPPVGNPLLDQDNSDVYDPTVTVATVGNQYILRGDLVGEANVLLSANVEKIPPEELEKQRTQILAARDKMAKQLLNQAVERKLMYLEFLRTIPEDKRAEAEASIQERVGEAFDADLEKMIRKVQDADEKDYPELASEDATLFRLAVLMKQQEMVTTIQLDNYLRRYGSSLEKQRQTFAETALGRQALVGGIETQPEVTHIEMLQYYNQRLEEFQVPDRARWEQLTVRFDHFNSREEARAAINAMGNEVWLGGAPLSAVAKRSSQGRMAKQGGQHDWTDWGDLEVTREIQQAVFTIPPRELSPVIEDVDGLHIVRVLERSPAHVTPFTEAQAAIKKKLRGEKRGKEITKFVAELRKQTPIWTIYDSAGDADQRVADPSPRPNANYPR